MQSGNIELSIIPIPDPPVILEGPKSLTIIEGNRVTLKVDTQGAGQLQFHWIHDDTLIPNETSNQLVLESLEQSHAGEYSVVVENGGGSVESDPAELLVIPEIPDKNYEIDWITTLGGIGSDGVFDLEIDQEGNSYFCGWFEEELTIGFGQSLQSTGNHDIFLFKLNPEGEIVWFKSAGGEADDKPLDIALGVNNELYLTGYIGGTASFEGQSVFSRGGNDIFVAKYDVHGNLIWVDSFGGPNWDQGQAITVDHIGNVYLTGWFDRFGNFGNPG